MPNRMLRDWIELKQKEMGPYSPGVYAFVVEDEILYIGSTWCLRNRCSNHSVKRFLKEEFSSVTVFYKVVENYLPYEKQLILDIKPKLNKQYLLSPKKGVKQLLRELLKNNTTGPVE